MLKGIMLRDDIYGIYGVYVGNKKTDERNLVIPQYVPAVQSFFKRIIGLFNPSALIEDFPIPVPEDNIQILPNQNFGKYKGAGQYDAVIKKDKNGKSPFRDRYMSGDEDITKTENEYKRRIEKLEAINYDLKVRLDDFQRNMDKKVDSKVRALTQGNRGYESQKSSPTAQPQKTDDGLDLGF